MSDATSGPSIPPETHAIDISNRLALAAIGDPQRCGVFEVLRCFRKAATLQELAVATGITRLRLAEIVDDLIDAGLVRAHRARGDRRQPTFAVTCQQVVVLYDRNDAAECESVRKHLDAVTADLTLASAESRSKVATHSRDTVHHESRGKFLLRPDQDAELRRRLHAVDEFINQIATDCAVSDPVTPMLCNHLIEMRVAPLVTPLLPLPWILAADRSTAATLAGASRRSTVPQLAPREQQIAIAMAHGESRPAIARRLGISAHTVATISKRIYAKLGVTSRAALANQLAALSKL